MKSTFLRDSGTKKVRLWLSCGFRQHLVLASCYRRTTIIPTNGCADAFFVCELDCNRPCQIATFHVSLIPCWVLRLAAKSATLGRFMQKLFQLDGSYRTSNNARASRCIPNEGIQNPVWSPFFFISLLFVCVHIGSSDPTGRSQR
jgi:hypothetical protein